MAAPASSSFSTTDRRMRRSKPSTLGSLLHYFDDLHITVELKNGRQYRGILQTHSQSTDDMSVWLHEAIRIDRMDGHQHSEKPKSVKQVSYQSSTSAATSHEDIAATTKTIPRLHIRGSTIRYIHFPPKANLARMVQHGKDRERHGANMYQRGVRKQRKEPNTAG